MSATRCSKLLVSNRFPSLPITSSPIPTSAHDLDSARLDSTRSQRGADRQRLRQGLEERGGDHQRGRQTADDQGISQGAHPSRQIRAPSFFPLYLPSRPQTIGRAVRFPQGRTLIAPSSAQGQPPSFNDRIVSSRSRISFSWRVNLPHKTTRPRLRHARQFSDRSSTSPLRYQPSADSTRRTAYWTANSRRTTPASSLARDSKLLSFALSRSSARRDRRRRPVDGHQQQQQQSPSQAPRVAKNQLTYYSLLSLSSILARLLLDYAAVFRLTMPRAIFCRWNRRLLHLLQQTCAATFRRSSSRPLTTSRS